MQCPDCGKPLDKSEHDFIYIFQCRFCGFSEKIYSENKSQAYESLVKRSNVSKERKIHSLRFDVSDSSSVFSPPQTIEEKKTLLTKCNIDPESIPESVLNIIGNQDIDLVYFSYLPPKPPTFAEKYPIELAPSLYEYLKGKGFESLYSFQVEAFEKITQGFDTIIVAPTGTGKTESFLLPVLQCIWDDTPNPLMRRGVQAIIIYPTKALAKDQKKKIQEMGNKLSITCEIFDGDTPLSKREEIYSYPPDIMITNPDMLHYHLRRPVFRSIISSVKRIIVDEIHVAVGAFGSNVFFILKRLDRLTSASLQFIGASATIGNAKEFGTQLLDRTTEIIQIFDARKAPTYLMMLYPSTVSQYTLTAEVIRQLVRSGHKTLCFQNSHKNTEIINLMTKKMKLRSGVHRAGLPKKHRERTEQAFRDGKLECIIATPTLELGIDIGDVDAVVSSIVDFTRFVQRLGRAGRKGQETISVLILRDNDPISTYYISHPDTYFTDIRQGFVEPKNEIVSYYQLLAAAIEAPLDPTSFFDYSMVLKQLLDDNLLKKTNKGKLKIKNRKQAIKTLSKYSIRGIGDTIKLKNIQNNYIGERSMPMAARELHPGAIYLHGGRYYQSKMFKYYPLLSGGEVLLEEIPPINHKTVAMRFAMPYVLEVLDKKSIAGTEAQYCNLQINETIFGYQVSDIYTSELKSIEQIDPIEYSFKTKGFLFTMPSPENLLKEYPSRSPEELSGGTFHAIEHVLIESSSMLTGGGTTEIGGISMGDSGIIFVYDGAKGGSGLSKLLYDRLETGLSRSLEILKKCSCDTIDGCPRCTYSWQCGNGNKPLNKIGAIESISMLFERQVKIIPVDDFQNYTPYI